MSKWERKGCGRGAVEDRDKYWAASITISCNTNGLATLLTVQMQKSCKYDVPKIKQLDENKLNICSE